MAKIFDDILLKGIRSGQVPARTGAARLWYRNKAKEAGKIVEGQILRGDTSRLRSRFALGSMYFFMYDPKHKDTLPYYDAFPLIFPIDVKPGKILGLNFHYLPLQLRAKLMDALYDNVTNDKYDETTRMKVSYSILSSVSKYHEFRPTLKMYLTSHIRTKLVYVNPSEWDIALFLDVAQFEKKSQTQVWAESRKKVKAG
jgi:hypothetical protein